MVFAFLFFTIVTVFAGISLRAGVSFLTPLVPFWKLLTTANFDLIFSSANYRRSITNSVVISLIGALIGTFFVAIIALVARRSEFRTAGR